MTGSVLSVKIQAEGEDRLVVGVDRRLKGFCHNPVLAQDVGGGAGFQSEGAAVTVRVLESGVLSLVIIREEREV